MLQDPNIYSDKFSKEKRKSRLREKITIIGLLFIISLFFIVPYIRGMVKEYKENNGSFKEKVINPSTSAREISSSKSSKTESKSAVETYTYDLDGTTKIKVEYTKANDVVIFSAVIGDAEKFSYDITPSKDKVVINDAKKQTISVIDKDFNKKDYTLNLFDGKSNTLKREENLDKKDFIWAKEAKFLNDNTIIYITNVANDIKSEYLRAITLGDKKENKLIDETKSKKIIISEKVEDGYIFTSDSTKMKIDNNLKVTKVN